MIHHVQQRKVMKDGRARRQVKGEEVRSTHQKHTPHSSGDPSDLDNADLLPHTQTLTHSYTTADAATPLLLPSLPFSHKPTLTESRQTKVFLSEWFLTPWSITEVNLSQPPDKPHTKMLNPSATPQPLSPSSRCEYGFYKRVILKQHSSKTPCSPMTQATLMTQHSNSTTITVNHPKHLAFN